MYTKEELESMDIPQLVGIADQLGIKVSPDDQLETVVYAILDKAAENSATADETPKRKRTRIAKKDTSRVYTVNGEEGENLDTKSNRTRKKVEAPSLFADMPTEEPAAAPVAPVAEEKPKKR
jgi:transcription termination factor Rho